MMEKKMVNGKMQIYLNYQKKLRQNLYMAVLLRKEIKNLKKLLNIEKKKLKIKKRK